jgi:hypothetical protein
VKRPLPWEVIHLIIIAAAVGYIVGVWAAS